ncbi:MAG: CRTAC1 family protein [Phycisphaerae bacterium]
MLSAASAVSGGPAIAPFTEEAVTRGLVYVMQSWPQAYGHFGFGCGFADLDGDGDPDIVVIGGEDARVGVFENDGAGHFTDRAQDNGIPSLPQGSGFAAGDADGDGDLDLYFTQIGMPNVLVRNDGGFQFTEVTATSGVGDAAASESAFFGDFNGDGWLDLYVVNYRNLTEDSRNRLYRNLGDGTFEDVAPVQGVDDAGYGFQAVWFDYDRDTDVDLYLSNDKGFNAPFLANQLWRNDGGQLVNVSEASGTDVGLFSMGMACGDFDGNGWPDLYCSNGPGGGGMNNPLMLNQGDGTFVRSEAAWGVDNPFLSWGALFFDFDNDGRQDLYVNNAADPNTLYHQTGTLPVSEVAAEAMVTGNTGLSYSSAFADVDGDGDLDLLVANLNNNVQLSINHEGEQRHWIRCRLVGSGHNTFAVGAGVSVRVADTWRFREVLAGGNGYKGQNELTVHVGLDSATMADEVVVQWPTGTTTVLHNVAADQTLTIYDPGSAVPAASAWATLILLLTLLTAGTMVFACADNRGRVATGRRRVSRSAHATCVNARRAAMRGGCSSRASAGHPACRARCRHR